MKKNKEKKKDNINTIENGSKIDTSLMLYKLIKQFKPVKNKNYLFHSEKTSKVFQSQFLDKHFNKNRFIPKNKLT